MRSDRVYRIKLCPGANGDPCVKGGAWLRTGGSVCMACIERATVWNGLVSAARVRRHLAKLSRRGVGYKQVADAAGVASSTLGDVLFGGQERIMRRTERRVLDVTVEAAADNAPVPAERTWKLIRKLLAEGFTKTELAKRLGSRAKAPALQIRTDRVQARTALRIERFYKSVMT